MSIIEMRDVVKKYDNGTTALRGITVNIDAGEFAYIVGPQVLVNQLLSVPCIVRSKSTKEACKLQVITSLRLKRKIFRSCVRKVGSSLSGLQTFAKENRL